MNQNQNINNFNLEQMNPFNPIQNQISTSNNLIMNNNNKRSDTSLLLSTIKGSIIIDSHAHPLFCCFTPEREAYSKIWTCKNCGNNYTFDIPSFYCTYCDYDFCQNCLMKLPLSKIKISNRQNKYEVYINIKHPNYKPNLDRHPLALIRLENYLYNDKMFIHCKKVIGKDNEGKNIYCRKNIQLTKDNFYYCSLCSTYICQDCFKNSNQNQNFFGQQLFEGIPSLNNIQHVFNPQLSNPFSKNISYNNYNNNIEIPGIPTINNNQNPVDNNQNNNFANNEENQNQNQSNNGEPLSDGYINN